MNTWYGAVAVTVSALAVTTFGSAPQQAIADEMVAQTTVHRFADQSVIDGATASLTRMDHGVATSIQTAELKEGDAVTMWWVIFNAPEKCSGGQCGEDDIFNLDADGALILKDDGSPPGNMAQREAARISVGYGDGHVIDAGGEAIFRGQLPVGDTSQTLFGPGLIDPMGAEIHLVVRTHQQAIPGQADKMTYNINGGCPGDFPNTPCEDVQFAVFMPVVSN